jgi:plasmid stability protein
MNMNKKIISFEAPSELKEALRVRAFRENTSISALIREILEQEVLQKPLTEGINE